MSEFLDEPDMVLGVDYREEQAQVTVNGQQIAGLEFSLEVGFIGGQAYLRGLQVGTDPAGVRPVREDDVRCENVAPVAKDVQ